jgi:hypothetical protein
MYHFKEAFPMTYRRFDFSGLALATLLVIQASIASYGLGLVTDIASTTHARLGAVVEATR